MSKYQFTFDGYVKPVIIHDLFKTIDANFAKIVAGDEISIKTEFNENFSNPDTIRFRMVQNYTLVTSENDVPMGINAQQTAENIATAITNHSSKGNLREYKKQYDNGFSKQNDLGLQVDKAAKEEDSLKYSVMDIESKIITLPSQLSMIDVENKELQNSLVTEQKKADQLDDQITKELSFNEAFATLLGQYDEYNLISQNGFNPQLIGSLTLEEQSTQIENLFTQFNQQI